MSHSKLKRETAEQLYIEMDKSMDDLEIVIGVCKKTLYRWSKAGNWDNKKVEIKALEKQINLNMKRALNQGLKSYADNPTDKDLQSLVSLLKQFREQYKPTQAYKDNIITFLDHTVDFFLERNMSETADVFKTCVKDLGDYLLRG